MPNWVCNTLKITGAAEDMKAFMEKAIVRNEKGTIWKLSNTLPLPAGGKCNSAAPLCLDKVNWDEVRKALLEWQAGHLDIDTLDISQFNDTKDVSKALCDDFCCVERNKWEFLFWGIKWDIIEEEIKTMTDTMFEIFFRSATYTPFKWLEHMILLYPRLKFKLSYYEIGFDMTGVFYSSKDGELAHQQGRIYWGDENKREIIKVRKGWIYQDDRSRFNGNINTMMFYSTTWGYKTWFEQTEDVN